MLRVNDPSHRRRIRRHCDRTPWLAGCLAVAVLPALACESFPAASTRCKGDVDCPAGQSCLPDPDQPGNTCRDDAAETTQATTTADPPAGSSAPTDSAADEGTESTAASAGSSGADGAEDSTEDPPPCIEVNGECLGITRLEFQTVCSATNIAYRFALPPGAETLIVPSVTSYGPGDVLIEPDGSRDQVFHIETAVDRESKQIDVIIGCALARNVPDNALKGYITAIGLPMGSEVMDTPYTFYHGSTCAIATSQTLMLPGFDDTAFARVERFVALRALELPTWNDVSLHNRDTAFETTLLGPPWELTGRLNAGNLDDQLGVRAYQVGLPDVPSVSFREQDFVAVPLAPPTAVEFDGLMGELAAPLVLVEDFDTEAPGQECETNVDNDLAFVVDVSPMPPTDGPMTEDVITVMIAAHSDDLASEVRGKVVLVTLTPD